jgi:hypothetical protein
MTINNPNQTVLEFKRPGPNDPIPSSGTVKGGAIPTPPPGFVLGYEAPVYVPGYGEVSGSYTKSGTTDDLSYKMEEKIIDPWVHRSARMKCETCMWYAPKKNDIGRCRRHAPTLNGYPVVIGSADWCGDHKLDEA